jgi:hypothetical protein
MPCVNPLRTRNVSASMSCFPLMTISAPIIASLA